MADDEIQVEVKGLVPTPSGSGVFLSYADKTIAIFIDASVASSINMFLHQVEKPRPLTHDLIGSIFTGLGVSAQKIVISDMEGDTFFARIHLLQENELGRNMVEIDARPSDSIAIALQQKCPVYVRRAVWEKAEDMSWALEQAVEEASEDGLES